MSGKLDSSKKASVILWVSISAAVAGVAAVAAIAAWKQRELDDSRVSTQLRGVQDVLSDCYHKIHEIQEHIPSAKDLTTNGRKSVQVFTADASLGD